MLGAGPLTITRATIAGGALVTAVVLAFAVRSVTVEQAVEPDAAQQTAVDPVSPRTKPADEVFADAIYGRITTVDDVTYAGRLRWGRDQEAFWGDFFNGVKVGNSWAVHFPKKPPFEIFGFEIGGRDPLIDRARQFMARFGDVARIEAHVGSVQVRLKSGTTYELDRFSAGDIDDGVRVWDGSRGVVDLDTRQIRAINFLPAAPGAAAAARLSGTVRTQQGDFSGFIQWDQRDGFVADVLDGRTAGGELSLRYDTIRSIARRSNDSALVTLLDGREMVLSDTRDAGKGNRGIYVDDRRYGRVLISWDAFEQVDFSPGGHGPAYDAFPPGRPLAGTVTLRDGRRLTGRLVYDFDESETTETLDVSLRGVDLNIPFSLISSILPHGRKERDAGRATVILHDGEQLQLERTGDLGDVNAGVLIFVEGHERPDYVPWPDVEQLDLDRERTMPPSPGGG